MNYKVDCKESIHHLKNIEIIDYLDNGVQFKDDQKKVVLYVSNNEINYFNIVEEDEQK